MINLADLLFRRFKKKRLAHFYIVNAPSSIERPEDFLKNWVNGLLTQVLMDSRNFSEHDAERVLELGHSDILVIEKETPETGYKVEDFNEFIRFQNFNNFELPHRFVVIHNAHNISEIISNKLLKTLEEPQDGTTILFLNPTNKHFIQTIESRAITLSLFTNEKRIVASKEFVSDSDRGEWILDKLTALDADRDLLGPLEVYLNDRRSIGDLIAAVRNNKRNQNLLFQGMLDWQRAHVGDFESKRDSLEEIVRFMTASRFNNPASERFFNLLSGFFCH